jgi:hypothetical protein
VAQRQAVREAFMAYVQARIREQLSAGTGEIDINVTSANHRRQPHPANARQ